MNRGLGEDEKEEEGTFVCWLFIGGESPGIGVFCSGCWLGALVFACCFD